jgi:hypothetical protein
LDGRVRTAARFPDLPRGRGHYESFYLKAVAPEGGRAVWIRETFHRRPGEEATAAVWMTWFDAERERPLALKRQVGEDGVSVPPSGYIRVDGCELGPEGSRGEVVAGDVSAAWDLRFEDRAEALRHLPAEWMYRAPLPRTKLLSPHPLALFSGSLEIGGERVSLEGWPGMVGHNWGAEHAATWVWIHAALGDGYLDLGAGRVKVGPLLVPWIANGQLVVDGEAHRLGGVGAVRSTTIDARPGSCAFSIPGGDGLRVRGRITAPHERTVGWLYSDPGGGEHNSLNSSIADLELSLEQPGREPLELRAEAAATYELGVPPGDHGVPIEPFPDG